MGETPERREPDVRERAVPTESESLAVDAAALGFWQGLLFWLVVLGAAAGIAAEAAARSRGWGDLEDPAKALKLLCDVGYCLALTRMERMRTGYRAAGIAGLLALGLATLAGLLDASGELFHEIDFLMVVPLGIITAAVSQCLEYACHAGAIEAVESKLSRIWRRLTKWYLIAAATGFVGQLLLLFPGKKSHALLTIAAAAAVGGVLSLVKLVCLWRGGKAARAYATGDGAGPGDAV